MRKRNIQTAAKITVREFCQQTSMQGYRYLVEPDRPNLERFMWYGIHIVCISFAIFIFMNTWQQFYENPTITSLQTQRYPMFKVPFPGVAVCSANKISQKQAVMYASELAKRDPSINTTWVYQQIQHLGKLYDYKINDKLDYQQFQDLLERIDVPHETGVYDTLSRMYMLAPKCEDLIIKCKWAGHYMDCPKNFTLRTSREGYCCMFNYVRQSQVLSLSGNVVKPLYSFMTGTDRGLVLLLNTTTSDYYYSTRNTVGFSINVFDAYDYPDDANGYLTQVILNNEVEGLLELEATSTISDHATMYYDAKQRGCMYHHELKHEFGGHYSQSDCLLKCRLKNIMKLCNCVPFYLPTNFPDTKTFHRCTLADVQCMHKYRDRINTVRPMTYENEPEFEHIVDDSISCPNCLPLCTSTMYKVQANFFALVPKNLTQVPAGILSSYPDVSNLSVVRIYFPFVSSPMYRTTVIYTWYEIISTFGGILGLCIGFSAIGVLELVYFSTIKLYQNWRPSENVVRTNDGPFSRSQKPPLTYRQMEMIMVEEYMKRRPKL